MDKNKFYPQVFCTFECPDMDSSKRLSEMVHAALQKIQQETGYAGDLEIRILAPRDSVYGTTEKPAAVPVEEKKRAVDPMLN